MRLDFFFHEHEKKDLATKLDLQYHLSVLFKFYNRGPGLEMKGPWFKPWCRQDDELATYFAVESCSQTDMLPIYSNFDAKWSHKYTLAYL